MNVINPKKRVPTAKVRQNKNIPNLLAEPITENNTIPKQHVGVEQANQLGFDPEVGRIFSPINNQGYINQINPASIPANDFYINENPFDLLPKDLFDVLLSEDDMLNQPETNKESGNKSSSEKILNVAPEEDFQPNEDNQNLQEVPEDEYEEILSQDESSTPTDSNVWIVPIVNHPLKPIVEKWLKQHPQKLLSSDKNIINGFIKFLVHKKVQAPTSEHFSLYYVTLKKRSNDTNVSGRMSVIRNFFQWAAEVGYYEDITLGTKNSLRIKKRNLKYKNNGKGQEIPRKKVSITIHDMETAKFIYNQAEYLINNDLIIFKRWLETLDDSFTNNQKKASILKFAHFLHSEGRTTPTQEDIIDYYKNHLAHLCVDTVNKSMVAIRHFFEWTAQEKIYPDIAVNIYWVKRKPISADDLPILPSAEEMKETPNPTEPLINKTI